MQSLLRILLILTCSLSAGSLSPVYAQAPVDRGDISQRLDRIEQLLQSQGLLDMLQQLQALKQELNQLRGEIEVQNHNIEQLRKRQRALYTDIDQRIQGMERSGGSVSHQPGSPPLQTLSPVYSATEPVTTTNNDSLQIEVLQTPSPAQQQQRITTPIPTVAPQTVDPAGSPAIATADVDPVQIAAEYQQAFDLLKQSQHEQAINAFRSFLANNPVNDYSDNAQYWLGEAFYVMRQFEQAIEEYNKLVSDYPDSQKLTHALLKIGYSYHELGQHEEATNYLQGLTRTYPGTTASRLAEDRLKAIALSQQQQQQLPVIED